MMDTGLNGIDTSKLTLIAEASGRQAHKTNWTELRIFFRPEGEKGRRPFLAEVQGRTTVPGQLNRKRRRQYGTLDEALDWFEDGRLRDDMIRKCGIWRDGPGARLLNATLVKVPAPGENIVIRQPATLGFTGQDGLEGALAWLYAGVGQGWTQMEQLAAFTHDFGVPNRTVRHAIKQQQDGKELPSWAKAFVGALMHFDRNAFHNAAGRPVTA